MTNLEEMAVRSALSSIQSDLRLPRNVFNGRHVDYLFLWPLALFEARFIQAKNLLLNEQQASVIALINLGNVIPSDYENPPALFLNSDTDAETYITSLKSKGGTDSWLILMDRYVCASDKGGWSIYCEKENDIAVMAIKSHFSRDTYLQLENLLGATSIKDIPAQGRESFDFEALVPEWRTSLKSEFVPIPAA